MVSITKYFPGIGRRKLCAVKSPVLLSAALILAVLVSGCGGERAEGSSGQGSNTSQPTAERTEETTPPPEETTARTENARAQVGNGAEARAGDAVAKAGNGAEARAGGVVARAGDGEARAGNVVAGDGDAGEAEARVGGSAQPRKARLRIEGTPGAEFSGTCAVGNEKEDISGQVPERFVYRLKGRGLECDVRLRGPGSLEIALIGDGTRVAQGISSPQNVVKLTYSSSGVSAATSSISPG